MRLGGEDTARRFEGVDKVYSSILDDIFTIFHWVFLPGIITLIMYSELDDNAERWVAEFEKDGKKVPNDLPARETLLTFFSCVSDNVRCIRVHAVETVWRNQVSHHGN
eukprot:sb/3477622/